MALANVVKQGGGFQDKPLAWAETVEIEQLAKELVGQPRDVFDMRGAPFQFAHESERLVASGGFTHAEPRPANLDAHRGHEPQQPT